MLEPDLKLLSLEEKSWNVKSVLKVMFRENPAKMEGDTGSTTMADQELEIPLSVLKAGLETLKMSMEWIPPHQRHDSDFSISYIDLSPVLQ